MKGVANIFNCVNGVYKLSINFGIPQDPYLRELDFLVYSCVVYSNLYCIENIQNYRSVLYYSKSCV